MKTFNIISLMAMAAAVMFTWSAVEASPQKIHILENLSPEEAHIAQAMMQKKGYLISRKPIFSEASEAIIITKTIKTEVDEASIQVEMVKMDHLKSLPRTTYQIRIPTDKVEEAISQFPNPAPLSDQMFMPVAFQPTEK